MTLRRRLLRLSIAQIVGVGMLFGAMWGLVRYRTQPMLEEHLEIRALTMTRELGNHLELPLAAADAAAAAVVVGEIVGQDADLLGVRVETDEQGLLHARGAGVASDLFVQEADVAHQAGDRVVSWTSVNLEGVPLGRIAVVFSTRRLEQLSMWMWALLAAGVIALIFAALVSIRFARRVVAPITDMMRFTDELAVGKLDHRLRTTEDGELGQLATNLNEMAQSLERRDATIVQRSAELEISLGQLRQTQEELLQSTRLASVGEMAGRTAHEVLNPITAIHARITRMSGQLKGSFQGNVETLGDIVAGWREVYERGGDQALFAELRQQVDHEGTVRTLLEEDLHNLDGIRAFIADRQKETETDLAFLLHEVDRVTRIVDGMRSMTRTAGSAGSFDVAEAIAQGAEIVRDSAEKRQIRLVIETASGVMVQADRYELIQVLGNLLRNSLQAIDEHGDRRGGAIRLKQTVEDGLVSVRICDDGIGIQVEHNELLFESTFTTRPADQGTGLGLGIARRLARGFGGDLVLESSEPGKGAVFLLTMPLARESVAEEPATEGGAGPQQKAFRGRGSDETLDARDGSSRPGKPHRGWS